ncbi:MULTISPECIES: replication initiator protein A [unclassified Bartonella]|uniref:replication initiator protein A n=1 Tax=unclassified Bartonella TaxID=2645622 RepID=UPI0021C99C1B|nr:MULTISPECIES: replication initiator protein A [unclassified Bartonella]UXN05058.1 replication initiator protein A [Bartonella sp. HY406]UXN05068.1 replication initiator protein A [Bartonella sp. HY406]UXN08112.1 replication initiator protein A [Bartonella sp. HY761]UXN08122.1 replication initiator protein A [Bartonella sp. HY761]
MEPDNTNRFSQLIPDRHPQHDLFICDVSDAVLKDVMQHLEHPFYSLSKKPETCVRRYEHNGHWLEITPSVKGLATIYDKDILIYCISQIMHKIKQGKPVSQRVRINSRDLLMFTNRGTSGRDYMALIEALDRLEGTRIRTNIVTGDEEQIDGFGLIDASSIRRKHGLDGRLLWCEVKLSDWVFSAIEAQEVLTLHRDYFRLRKPLERRVYEIARKHCGQQDSWKISLALLLKKTGSQSSEKRFRQMIRNLAQHDHLPDYHVAFEAEHDMVMFKNRGTMKITHHVENRPIWTGQLSSAVYVDAREAAPGWDIYMLEDEWRAWLAENEITPNYPEKHFLKFCSSWFSKRGKPA